VVYEHFGGKEGLYAVVVDREVERFLTMATTLLEGEDTREKFEAAAVIAAQLHRGETRRLPHPGP
jgi:AcrR family transcriptional regulator